jgi:hypothetical protein
MAAGLCLVVVLAHEAPNYLRPASEWARRKHGMKVVEDRDVARAVGALLRPPETLFEYGDGAALYYYTGLRPSTMTLWSSHLLIGHPLSERLGVETLAQLEANPPDLFVLQSPSEWAATPPEPPHNGLAFRLLGGSKPPPTTIRWDQHPIYLWAMAHYQPWPAGGTAAPWSSRMTLYVRAGSALAHRLAGQ